jgi:hypothetical protein
VPWWVFEGKEGKNNKKVIELLAEHSEPMIAYDIRDELGIRRENNSTILYRTKSLEEIGILRTVPEVEKSNRIIGPFYQLSTLGLLEAAKHLEGSAKRAAIDRCKSQIVKGWRKLVELYKLEQARSEYITKWLETDEGVFDFLEAFGHNSMESERSMLLSCRRMFDLALLSMHTGSASPFPSLTDAETGEYFEPSEAIATIATNHILLSKLHDVLIELDAPLYSFINKESTEKLRAILPQPIAEKLATSPFFKHQTGAETGEALRYISTSSLQDTLEESKRSIKKRKNQKNRLHFAIYEIVIERGRVTIITEDPENISTTWKAYCDLCILKKKRNQITVRIEPARRVEI